MCKFTAEERKQTWHQNEATPGERGRKRKPYRTGCNGTVFFSHISFSTQPMRKVCIANRNIGQFFVSFILSYFVLVICAVGISLPSIFNNYSPKWRWLAVDIYRAAKRRGKYPTLATDTEVNSCFSIY